MQRFRGQMRYTNHKENKAMNMLVHNIHIGREEWDLLAEEARAKGKELGRSVSVAEIIRGLITEHLGGKVKKYKGPVVRVR